LDGLQQQASWRTTYLDDEWRVGRGEPSDAVFLFKRQTQEQAEAEAAAAAAAVDGGAYLHPPMDALAGLLWVYERSLIKKEIQGKGVGHTSAR